MKELSKRDFLKMSALCTGGLFCPSFLGATIPASKRLSKWSKETYFYTVTPKGVKCLICPNECTLSPGEESECHNRIVVDDKLYSIAYGNPCAIHIDPIEKKPLLHFHPQSTALSIATAGCNFACLNCQNWEISQRSPNDTKNYDLMPDKVVETCIGHECSTIAFTYSEPTSFYEYMYDTAVLAHEKNIRTVWVSNGYMNSKPLQKLVPYLDAANIDLKAFDETIHLKLTGGKLQPVLDTLLTLKENNVWLEITNLVVPSWTDDYKMIRNMCQWLVANGLDDYPLHFSRFSPLYKLTQLPATPLNTLIQARSIALEEGCKYVYIGNVPGKGFEDTHCPECHKTVVERRGFVVLNNYIKDGKCGFCGAVINGVWDQS